MKKAKLQFMPSGKHRLVTGVTIFIVATILAIMLISRIRMKENKIVLTPASPQVNAAEDESKTLPTFIRIPELNIAVVIKQTTKASERGSGIFMYEQEGQKEINGLIFYGSGKELNNLSELQKNDKILILTQDGILHIYQVTRSFYSSFPKINPKPKSIYLTTPTYFTFQKRLVIEADLLN